MPRSVRGANGGFRSLVCAVDFSLPSYAALEQAVQVAKAHGGHLTVVCVEDPLTGAGAAASGYDIRLLRQSTMNQLNRLLQRTATPAGLDPAQWSVDVLLGKPARAIVAFAKKNRADLIVIGTDGRRGPAKWFFGSVANAILRCTPVPVLVVARRTATSVCGRNGRVLGALEFGAQDGADGRRLAQAADTFGGPLTLLHVVRPSDSPSGEAAAVRYYQQQLGAARLRLQALANRVGAAVRVALGKPETEIAAVAAEMKARLIVLVLRRGRGIFGPRQGATTYRVLCSSPVPVLALPPM